MRVKDYNRNVPWYIEPLINSKFSLKDRESNWNNFPPKRNAGLLRLVFFSRLCFKGISSFCNAGRYVVISWWYCICHNLEMRFPLIMKCTLKCTLRACLRDKYQKFKAFILMAKWSGNSLKSERSSLHCRAKNCQRNVIDLCTTKV